MLQIATTVDPVDWDHASKEALEVFAQTAPFDDRREISDASARAIAGHFASDKSPGWSLAVLAQGIAVPYEPFRDDLSNLFTHTRTAFGADSPEYISLCCLGTWGLRHPKRDER